MLTQADAATYDPVWLVDFKIEGRQYRYTSGSSPVTVTHSDGLSYIYRPGMTETRLSLGDRSAAVEVLDGTDWAGLAAAGANMEGGRATVRRWWPSLKLDESASWSAGLVRNVEWGEVGEPLVFTVEALNVDTDILLPLNAKATSPMQGGTSPPWEVYPATEGAPFPIVIGYPGERQDASNTTHPVVPCLITDYYALTSLGEDSRAVLSVGAVDATTVDVSFFGEVITLGIGETLTPRTVATATIPTHDGATPIDMLISYFDFTGTMVDATVDAMSALPQSATSNAEYYAGFKVSTGGGIKNPYGDGVVAGAGDVVIWAMRSAGGDLPVDYGQLETIRERLNHFRIDTWINDPEVRALEWLRRNVLPLLPVVETSTLEGWALAFFDYSANEKDVIDVLEAGRDVERASPAAVINAQEIANHVTVQYRPTGTGRGYLSQVTLTGSLYYAGDVSASGEIDNPTYPHKIAQISQARHGVRRAEFQATQTWDDATALRIAQDVLKARGLALVGVTYDALTDALERATVGDVYALTDPAMGWDERIAIVYEVTVGGGQPPTVLFALPDPLLKRPTGG